ncbi:methyltransferase [Aureococcus anophagefferens]|nr:methyltransferase [Aureococcus anophagefferens]
MGGDAAARDWAAARYGGPPADEAARLGPLDSLGAADHAARGALAPGFGVAARRHFDLALALGDPLGAARAARGARARGPALARWRASRRSAGLGGGAAARCTAAATPSARAATGPARRGPATSRTSRARSRARRGSRSSRSPDDDVDDLFAHPSVAREAPLLARAVAFVLRECPPAGYGEAAAAPRPRRAAPRCAWASCRRGSSGPVARVAVSAARALDASPSFVTVACCFATAPSDDWTAVAYGAFEEQRRCPATSPARATRCWPRTSTSWSSSTRRATRAAVLAAAGAPRR